MQPPQPSHAAHVDRRTCAHRACPPAPLAAEGAKQAAKIGAAVVGAGLGAFITKQLAAKRQSAAIIELSNLLVRSLVGRLLLQLGAVTWRCACMRTSRASTARQGIAPLRSTCVCAGVSGQPHPADPRHGGSSGGQVRLLPAHYLPGGGAALLVWGGAASAVQQSSAGAADGRLTSEQPCFRC